MKFNSIKTRLVLSFCFALLTYILLWGINRFNYFEFPYYSFVAYSLAVFSILLILFESHNKKSVYLERRVSWKDKLSQRFWLESLFTLLATPLIVTLIIQLLYIFTQFDLIWHYGILEYNLFALPFSFIIAVFVNADRIIYDWKKSISENEFLEKENSKAKINILQAQISPHFLFNNFNALNALIEDSPKIAQQYLDALSDIYRYLLNYKNEELVPLGKELEFIEKYLFLLKIRFNNNIKCVIEIDELSDLFIPPATFQILVENAVRHNEISTRRQLHISIKKIGNSIIQIKNNLQPKKGNHTGSKLGLKNISDRFLFYTDNLVQVTRTNEEFIVDLPILKIIGNEYSNL